ncbi:ABC transporter [Macleaya cordata]|uniref:ABC transporter n=1 Tax=Macleaya cordata TaxID=56857 RepID=A0A200Q3R5_MACCD|nr:ABC transporter [Macleaya cordata]
MMEALWTVFCGKSECSFIAGKECSSGFSVFGYSLYPYSCINNFLVISIDILLFLVTLLNFTLMKSSRRVQIPTRFQGFSFLHLCSAITNCVLGLLYMGLGVWILEEKLRKFQTILPLHWWLVVLVHGSTCLSLGLVLSFNGGKLSKTFLMICSVLACIVGVLLCVPSLLVIIGGKEIETILDVLMFPGVILLLMGKDKILQDDDIPRVRKADRAETCYLLFMEQMEKIKQTRQSSPPSVLWIIVLCHWKEILVSGFFALLSVLTVSSGPLLLSAFIEVAEGKEAFKYEGYTLAGVIYQKQLRLSNTAKMTHSAGEIMNYVTVDAYRIGEFPFWLHQIWTTILQLCIALAILYHSMGLATLSTFVVVILTVLCTTPLAKLQHKYQTKLMVAQDERLKGTSEAFVNMKVLKLYAWEINFKNVIAKLRKEEYKWLSAVQLQKAYYGILFWSCPVLVSAVTFGTCYFLGVPLFASNVFTVVATLRLVQEPIRLFPNVVEAGIQAKVALSRIVNFLDASELQSGHIRQKCNKEELKHSVFIDSAIFSWEENSMKPTLRNINLEVKPGEKVAICGEVGSGKSTLLAAILGEVPIIGGTVQVYGKIAYVSQTAWIQTGTMRENILFGSTMDENQYQEAIEKCSLAKDLDMLPFGDLTEIGERGVNLSGGQKQRIQLARAIYRDADVYLLDDPFSAIDAQTATSLFNEYVIGALSGKTVLLVTHQVDFLPTFDSILFMSDGEIQHAAVYHQLLAFSKPFQDLVNAHKETVGSENLNEFASPQKFKTSKGEIMETYDERQLKASGGDQLIKDEERETGDMGLKPYKQYLNQNKGFVFFFLSNLCHLLFTVGQILQNAWMAAHIQDPSYSRLRLIVVYSAIGCCSVIFLLGRFFLVVLMGLKSSESLFSQLMSSLFRAPMSFYDSTPLGRIYTRVSSDLSIVDLDVPFSLGFAVGAAITTYSNFGVMVVLTWQLLFVCVLIVYMTIHLQRYYLATSKELMRINGTTKSMVANQLAESIAGAFIIRAFEEQDQFFAKYLDLVDKNASPFFHNFTAREWLFQRLEILCAVVLSSSALMMALLPPQTLGSGYIGMALSYGLSLNLFLVFSVQNQCALANHIVSVERLNQYMHIPSEAPEVIEGNRPKSDWPTIGEVQIHDLKIRYRPNAPLVLRGISCTLEGGHKIGIVGRTGSGKTTLISALFRLVEPTEGKIIIDGLDISKIGLHDLRSHFGIIPQDPTLFHGSVRYNLDPLSHHTDQELWEVLEKCQLRDAVNEKEESLDSLVVEDGSNWSMGQRQLFALGRALLRKIRILVLDEATASIDNATDMILQKTIRSEFANCTVITVAHRIPTVMDSTMVLGISDGKLVEFDKPTELMKREGSLFRQLVNEYWSHTANTNIHAGHPPKPILLLGVVLQNTGGHQPINHKQTEGYETGVREQRCRERECWCPNKISVTHTQISSFSLHFLFSTAQLLSSLSVECNCASKEGKEFDSTIVMEGGIMVETLYTVFCGKSDCLSTTGKESSSGFATSCYFGYPSLCINHVLVISVDILVFFILSLNFINMRSSRRVYIPTQFQGFSPLQIFSAIFNGGMGLFYMGFGIWILEENIRNFQTLLPLHSWIVVLIHGCTWMLLGLAVSLKGRTLQQTVSRICLVLACMLAGVCCTSSLLVLIVEKEASIEIILGILMLPGLILLLLCVLKGYKKAEIDQTINSSLYTALNYKDTGNREIDSDEYVTPFSKAGFLSRMSFWWINPLMKMGKVKILQDDDIPWVRKVDRAESCYLLFMEKLDKQKQTRQSSPASILWTIKQLRLSNSAKMIHSAGEIMNYVIIDAYRIGEFPYWLHHTWTTIVQLCIALAIFYHSVGLATISTVILLILTMLCITLLAKLQNKYQTKLMGAQGERLRGTSEAFVNMKVLKLYAWESHFRNVLEKLRKEEYKWQKCSKEELKRSIFIESAYLSWEENRMKPTLRNINLEVKPGEKVAICGEVGSGKSTLLAAILGEVPTSGGIVQVYGKIAYVSQSAWVQTGTIRDNILFGSTMDANRYQEALEKCSLTKDLDMLPFGDLTEIGERGVTLSGGQKQRIQLARAIYRDADVYLLDDPFSAIDAQTATSLFNEYVMGALSGKTVLLVTHQLMSDGEILHAAAYDQLLACSKEFQDLVNAHKDTVGSERLDEIFSPQKFKTSKGEIMKTYNEKQVKSSLGDQLVKHEERETGDMGLKPYKQYLNQNKGYLYFSMANLSHLIFIAGQILQNSWMATHVQDPNFSRLRLILVCSAIGCCSILFLLFRSFLSVQMGLESSKSLFSQLMSSLFHAPMSFYDSTPLGRIYTRVSSDLSIIDLDFPFNLCLTVFAAIVTYSNLGVLVVITWQLLLVVILIVYVTMRIQRYYFATAKELMRINCTTKSLVVNHLAESIAGAMTIRAFDEEDQLFSKYLYVVDKNASPFFHNFTTNEWLMQRLKILCAIVLSSSALIMSLLLPKTLSSGLIGMALSYGLSLNASFAFSIQNQCVLENNIVSMERLNQYMHIPSEAPEVIEGNRPISCWPTVGKVEIHDLKIRYRPNAPLVLRGISCTFEGGHKIGIVGRTGSGKTTLISALFRLVEPTGGKIIIDGLDISKIGLYDLRSHFGIIPQDPTLFHGSVRYNLDPLSQHTDQELWEVLEKCQLREAVSVKEESLDSLVVEDGSNWSMGQRQLFALGRALLRRSRILVLDEATASIDNATDMILQKTIRKEFANCTVITVAHRIPTVMDSTMVLGISDGKLVEFDKPEELMKREGSLFRQLVNEYWSHTQN